MTYREYAKQTNKTWTQFATEQARELLMVDNSLSLKASDLNEETKTTFRFEGVNDKGTTMKDIIIDMDNNTKMVYNFNQYCYRYLVYFEEGFMDLTDAREDYTMSCRADRVITDNLNNVKKVYKDRCITEFTNNHVTVRSIYGDKILAELERSDLGYFLSKKGPLSYRCVGDVYLGVDDHYMNLDEFLFWYEYKKLPVTKNVVTDLRNHEELSVRMGFNYPCPFIDDLCEEIEKKGVTYENVIEFKEKGYDASDSNPIFSIDTLDRHRLVDLY